MGIGHGDSVGIMCRDHRGFIESTLAAAKLGAASLFLNTQFPARNWQTSCERERPKVLVHDAEFTDILAGVSESVTRVTGLGEQEGAAGATLEALIPAGSPADLSPRRQGPLRSPHLGHDRHTEGRPAFQPRRPAYVAALIDRIPTGPARRR